MEIMTEISKNLFRKAMRNWVTGVTVVSTYDKEGRPRAMTATSLAPVSDSPPSLLLCINNKSKMIQQLTSGNMFSVNILSSSHENLSAVCADPEQHEKRFCGDEWIHSETTPRVKEALATFECYVGSSSIRHGTHTVIIGSIVKVYVSDEPAPLAYFRGGYISTGT